MNTKAQTKLIRQGDYLEVEVTLTLPIMTAPLPCPCRKPKSSTNCAGLYNKKISQRRQKLLAFII